MIEIYPLFQEQFECINSQVLKKIIQNLKIKLFSKGQMLFSQGDKADFAYLILHGEIGFYQHDLSRCKNNQFLRKKGAQIVFHDDASFSGT